MKYKTCISIAEKTPDKIKSKLKIALKKSDYVEIRLDFLKIEQIPNTLEIIKKDLNKIVCTLRPKTEGGAFTGNEKERISIIKLIAEYNPFLLDIELNTLKKNKELVKYLKSTKTKLLVSWHDFKKTPALINLNKKLREMLQLKESFKHLSLLPANIIDSNYFSSIESKIINALRKYGSKSKNINELIELIKNKYHDRYKIVIAPGPSEINETNLSAATKVSLAF